MIYLDTKGKDCTPAVIRHIARNAVQDDYRRGMLRRFRNEPTLPPISYGRTPPTDNNGAPAQLVV